VDFGAKGLKGVDCGFGDALTLQVLRQERYVVVEAVQAFMLDGGGRVTFAYRFVPTVKLTKITPP
jgi:hypothetical protein